MEWFKTMQANFNISPDIHTYAIWIFHYLHSSQIQKAKDMVQVLEEQGLELNKLLLDSQFMDNDERELLVAFLNDLGKLENIQQSPSDALLLSAFHDLKNTNPSPPNNDDAYTPAERAEIQALKAVFLKPTNSGGVSILRKTLDGFGAISHMEKYNQQMWIEQRSYTAAVEQHELNQSRIPLDSRQTTIPRDVLVKWHGDLTSEIKKMLHVSEGQLNVETDSLRPFMNLLTPEQLSKITIAEFLRVQSRRGEATENSKPNMPEFGKISAVSMTMSIGKSVQREYNLTQLDKPEYRREVSLS